MFLNRNKIKIPSRKIRLENDDVAVLPINRNHFPSPPRASKLGLLFSFIYSANQLALLHQMIFANLQLVLIQVPYTQGGCLM